MCWVHDGLQDLARRLGVNDAPAWPGPDYDTYWVIGDFEKYARGKCSLKVKRQGVSIE